MINVHIPKLLGWESLYISILLLWNRQFASFDTFAILLANGISKTKLRTAISHSVASNGQGRLVEKWLGVCISHFWKLQSFNTSQFIQLDIACIDKVIGFPCLRVGTGIFCCLNKSKIFWDLFTSNFPFFVKKRVARQCSCWISHNNVLGAHSISKNFSATSMWTYMYETIHPYSSLHQQPMGTSRWKNKHAAIIPSACGCLGF